MALWGKDGGIVQSHRVYLDPLALPISKVVIDEKCKERIRVRSKKEESERMESIKRGIKLKTMLRGAGRKSPKVNSIDDTFRRYYSGGVLIRSRILGSKIETHNPMNKKIYLD